MDPTHWLLCFQEIINKFSRKRKGITVIKPPGWDIDEKIRSRLMDLIAGIDVLRKGDKYDVI